MPKFKRPQRIYLGSVGSLVSVPEGEMQDRNPALGPDELTQKDIYLDAYASDGRRLFLSFDRTPANQEIAAKNHGGNGHFSPWQKAAVMRRLADTLNREADRLEKRNPH
jgi:hypothetical protein